MIDPISKGVNPKEAPFFKTTLVIMKLNKQILRIDTLLESIFAS